MQSVITPFPTTPEEPKETATIETATIEISCPKCQTVIAQSCRNSLVLGYARIYKPIWVHCALCDWKRLWKPEAVKPTPNPHG